MQSKTSVLIFATALVLGISAAGAQTIQRSAQPFVEMPSLPFAPAAAPKKSESAAPAPTSLPAGAVKVERWEVRTSDIRIDRTLERWAQQAGWRVQWDAARHVEVGAPTAFSGSFEQAVKATLNTPGIRLSEFPLEACIYPNDPPLLRVTRQGEQSVECPMEFK